MSISYLEFLKPREESNALEFYLKCLDAFFLFDDPDKLSYDAYTSYAAENHIESEFSQDALDSLRNLISYLECEAQEETERLLENPELYALFPGQTLPDGSTFIGKLDSDDDSVEPVKPEPATASSEVPAEDEPLVLPFDEPEEFIEPEENPDLPFGENRLIYLEYLDKEVLLINYVHCILEFAFDKRYVCSYEAYREYARNNGYTFQSYQDAFVSLADALIITYSSNQAV